MSLVVFISDSAGHSCEVHCATVDECLDVVETEGARAAPGAVFAMGHEGAAKPLARWAKTRRGLVRGKTFTRNAAARDEQEDEEDERAAWDAYERGHYPVPRSLLALLPAIDRAIEEGGGWANVKRLPGGPDAIYELVELGFLEESDGFVRRRPPRSTA